MSHEHDKPIDEDSHLYKNFAKGKSAEEMLLALGKQYQDNGVSIFISRALMVRAAGELSAATDRLAEVVQKSAAESRLLSSRVGLLNWMVGLATIVAAAATVVQMFK